MASFWPEECLPLSQNLLWEQGVLVHTGVPFSRLIVMYVPRSSKEVNFGIRKLNLSLILCSPRSVVLEVNHIPKVTGIVQQGHSHPLLPLFLQSLCRVQEEKKNG